MNSSTLRIATTVVAACGVLGVLAFDYYWADGFAWHRSSLGLFLRVAAPYFVVVVAAAFSNTRTLATITFAASLAILALGAQTYLSLYGTGPNAINDITLTTFPLQHLLSYAALAAAVLGFIVHRVRHATDIV
jgi:hypothetical protein